MRPVSSPITAVVLDCPPSTPRNNFKSSLRFVELHSALVVDQLQSPLGCPVAKVGRAVIRLVYQQVVDVGPLDTHAPLVSITSGVTPLCRASLRPCRRSVAAPTRPSDC